MRAITIYEPHAILVAVCAKRYETRGWATDYRGPIAIHAGKTASYLDITYQEPFRRVLKAAGFKSPADLPLGCIVCTAELVKVWPVADLIAHLTTLERAFGDFSAGRFAWEFRNVQIFARPIPARGQQGLWEWKQP